MMGWRERREEEIAEHEPSRWAYFSWAAVGVGGILFWGGLTWSLAVGRALSRHGTMPSGHGVPIPPADGAQLGLPERASPRAL
jgi:hypothetical protein